MPCINLGDIRIGEQRPSIVPSESAGISIYIGWLINQACISASKHINPTLICVSDNTSLHAATMPRQPAAAYVLGVGMTKFIKPRGKVDCK